jgi:hypothetical protein
LAGIIMVLNGFVTSAKLSFVIFMANMALILFGTMGYSYIVYLKWKKENNK